MRFPQEEKDEEAIDLEEEEEEEEGGDSLAELPQRRSPTERKVKRQSTLSKLFDRGNKGRLDKDEQQARDMANADGSINPDAALANVKHQRRLTKMLWASLVLSGCTIIGLIVMALKTNGSLNQGTVEVKDAILESTSTSVGMDNNGHSVLQDVHTNQQVSVRGFGDPFVTQTKVDPITGRRLSCMNMGEVAELFHDAVSRTEASITFMDENGVEKEVVPVNGHFVDHGRTLHFGTGKDSVTMIMDSDACNTGTLLADPQDTQDPSQVEPREDEANDGAFSDGEEEDTDGGVFKRGLREPSSALAVVPSPSEVLDRHRNEFALAKAAVRSGRKMQSSTLIPVCSGFGCTSESDSELRTDLIGASECPIGRELTENECQEAAGELEVGEFDGVWNRDAAANLPCGCFLWNYPVEGYSMVLYRNVQAGCSANPNLNLGMICKKNLSFYGNVISDGACRSEVGRLAYNHITNNMVDIVASSGPASACADFCSLYDRRPGYVGFSVRITGTSNLEDYPIGRCQCQFEGGTEQPDLSDAPASTTSWWGSTASLPIDVLQGNGNSDYVCYPWIPMAFFWQATQGVKVVFVTSKRYNGGLGGLAGANDKCQARADAAGLDGTFKAWLSTSNSSPLSWNHNGGHSYYLVDGTKIADDWAHLTNANYEELYHEIDVNEFGETVTNNGNNGRVWSNTNWNGNQPPNAADYSCNFWYYGGDHHVVDGRFGSLNEKNHNWSWAGDLPCNTLMRLYCIQQDV